MNIGSQIGYWILLNSCRAVGALPDWFLYHPLQDFIYFIVYKVVKYRRTVVRINLRNSFPDYTPEQRLEIERRFYRHLSEIFVDTIDLVGISHKDVMERITFDDIDKHEAEVEGTDWIAALAHYGSWEYFASYQLYADSHDIAGVYRPLHNLVFDKFFKSFRIRAGSVVVPMSMLMRFMLNRRADADSRNVVLGLIADQVPPNFHQPHQFTFMNQPTAFFMGVEKMALRFNMPVYFVDIVKTERAHYRLDFEMLYDGVEQVEEYEITRRYVERLERMIREVPELWLWSHRRWKHNHESQCL